MHRRLCLCVGERQNSLRFGCLPSAPPVEVLKRHPGVTSGGGGEETTLFLPLAPTLHLYGLKLDSSVFSTEDICIL